MGVPQRSAVPSRGERDPPPGALGLIVREMAGTRLSLEPRARSQPQRAIACGVPAERFAERPQDVHSWSRARLAAMAMHK